MQKSVEYSGFRNPKKKSKGELSYSFIFIKSTTPYKIILTQKFRKKQKGERMKVIKNVLLVALAFCKAAAEEDARRILRTVPIQ